MNIHINGKQMAKNMDIVATANKGPSTHIEDGPRNGWHWTGTNMAVDVVFNNIKPQNGIIDIRLTGNNEAEAIIQAIEIGPGNSDEGAKPISFSPNQKNEEQ